MPHCKTATKSSNKGMHHGSWAIIASFAKILPDFARRACLLPVNTAATDVMTTDITTEGPVMWQAENPTMRNTAMAQNPAKPVLNNLVTSGQVVCLTCLTTHSGLLPPSPPVMVIWDTDDTLSKYNGCQLICSFRTFWCWWSFLPEQFGCPFHSWVCGMSHT